MEIGVCVKPVLDPSIVSLEGQNRLDPDDMVCMVNPCDRAAVEEAVRLKQMHHAERVTILSIALPSTEDLLRRCLAMGADRAVRFWDDAFNCVYNDLTGRVLARLIRHFSFDLVFCGRQASDNDMGHTGYAIAAQLGIPFIQKAVKIEISREGTATISSKLEGGKREMVEVDLPAVVGIERDINEPRYAGLPALIAALREDIVQIDLKEIGMSASEIDSRVKCIGISPPRPRPKKIFKPDSSLSAADRLRLIMSGGLAEKKEELFEGSPEDLSQKFVQFLNQEKILQQN